MNRPICRACMQNHAAINYRRDDRVYYRKFCDPCMRRGRKAKLVSPAWVQSGYRKKDRCDCCGWRAKYPDRQMTVYHVDGNLRNNNPFNLKTVCLNCRVEIAYSRLPWRETDVKPDL